MRCALVCGAVELYIILSVPQLIIGGTSKL